MSWHCSESPVVSVASKSVITITSFAVRSAMAARFLSQWKGAEGDQSQTCRRARSTRSAVMAAMAPITPASKLEGAIIMAAIALAAHKDWLHRLRVWLPLDVTMCTTRDGRQSAVLASYFRKGAQKKSRSICLSYPTVRIYCSSRSK